MSTQNAVHRLLFLYMFEVLIPVKGSGFTLGLTKYMNNVSLCDPANNSMHGSALSSNFSNLYALYYTSTSNASRSERISLNATCECLNSSLIANFSEAFWYRALTQSIPNTNATEKTFSSISGIVLQRVNISLSQLFPNEHLSENVTVIIANLFCGPPVAPISSPNATNSGTC